MEYLDNTGRQRLGDALRDSMDDGARLSIIASYFTVFAFGEHREYLRAMANDVMLARAIDALGFYPQARAKDQERILVLSNRYDVLQGEVRQLHEQRRGRDVTLNESAKLRIRMRKAENQRDAILNEIKELCHG